MDKYHTNSHGPDREALVRAYKHTLELAQAGSSVAYISTHTTNNVTSGLSAVLGNTGVKRLVKEKSLTVDGGVILYLQTEKIAPAISESGPVLAPYVSLQLALAVLEDSRASTLVYVPWTEKELSTYLAANGDSQEI
ncbi:hypothetical protein [Desulfonatronum lacustre]|uniref:hypothetical protein n=1 Tax=Desulfonatronum lacustre TaxID=66849 RepID=UPI00048C92D8|nr:hypothetical protein [Desulfonatronum lacustre]